MRIVAFLLSITVLGPALAVAAPYDPAASDYSGHQGKTLYVSKLGDNSDGSSWATALHSIQAALLAVPDDKGGHQVVVRPDTYAEANLYPSHKGAVGSYNLLVGDVDGSLGSGTTGWIIIDSGAPLDVVRTNPKARTGNPTWMIVKSGDPSKETGLKSVDWWGPIKSNPDFSAAIWDRWIFRGLYATAAEGGFGWDMTCESGTEFSVIVEDCVGIGRFAGVAVMGHVGRKSEPVVFRRSYFMCLDWWGDAGAAYVRAHNKSMPAHPDAIFEDCTLVGPDNAVQAGNPGFDGYSRVELKNCRLIVLNFSQPHGTPSTGIIASRIDGKYLHVDLEDCTLMGFKVFGVGDDAGQDDVSYSVKGNVQAYVQYRQPVPDGMERLRFWPVEAFDAIRPPAAAPTPIDAVQPKLTKLPTNFGPQSMENTPVTYNGRPLLVLNYRDDTKYNTDEYKKSMHLHIKDLRTGTQIARFGAGHSFASAFVRGDELNVFASEGTDRDWFQSIYRFSSTDLKTWKRELAIPLDGDEHLFNCSVCRDEAGYLMAYESNLPVKFCFKFARSKDLAHWEKIDDLVFTGEDNEYSACPVLRYFAPYYYVIYLHRAVPGHKGWVSFMARSKDLASWELSPMNPILEATTGEGLNNSDVDLFEHDGNTYVFYATGDQATWGTVRMAMYPGPMKQFFQDYFPEDLPMVELSTTRQSHGEPDRGRP